MKRQYVHQEKNIRYSTTYGKRRASLYVRYYLCNGLINIELETLIGRNVRKRVPGNQHCLDRLRNVPVAKRS